MSDTSVLKIPLRVLHLEDSPDDSELVHATLISEGIPSLYERVETRDGYIEALQRGEFDVVLADYTLPAFDGLSALQLAREKRPEIPFIFVSGSIGEERAIEVLRQGATDYVFKEKLSRLAPVLRRALLEARNRAERRRAEADLRKSEAKYRQLVANMPDILWAADEKGTMAFITDNVEATLGFSPREIYDGGEGLWLDRVHSDDLDPTRKAYAALMQGKGRFDVEFRIRRKDDQWIWMHARAVSIYEQGGKVFAYGLFSDVTANKNLEQQLTQSQKMESIGQLAGGVAHDFNNLLTVITGYSDLLLTRLPPTDPARVEIEEIRKAGERAASLTRQLLAFTRKQMLSPKVIDLNSVVREMDKMLQRLLGPSIQLVTLLAPDLGRIRADRSQMEQVVMNLAVNARDAMPQGGKLTIETANANLDETYLQKRPLSSPGPYVLMAMTDTGHGMNRETQLRIFEPFFTTKGPGKGTGLGLSTVYGVIKQSQGSIEVYSEVGHGTTFKIYLPRFPEASSLEPEPLQAEQTPSLGYENILVVEDHDQIRDLAGHILQTNGYTVLAARNPQEALEIAARRRGKIDLFLTDLMIPEFDGVELVRRLNLVSPGAKVLYMSGYMGQAVVHQKVLESGAPFLQKPFTQADLLRKIREVLGPRKANP